MHLNTPRTRLPQQQPLHVDCGQRHGGVFCSNYGMATTDIWAGFTHAGDVILGWWSKDLIHDASRFERMMWEAVGCRDRLLRKPHTLDELGWVIGPKCECW